MFDIGFSEIVVIAVVALIVIGPEKLPKTARTLGHLFGRLQRYVNDVKADINREMELDELRKLQQRGADRRPGTSRPRFRPRRTRSNRACARWSRTSTPPPAGEPQAAAAEMRPLSVRPPETASAELAAAPPAATAPPAAEPPRQASLPGFERG